MVIVEKAEGKQADNKFIFEDICIDAPESKIQSVPASLRTKLFMALMKAAGPKPVVGEEQRGQGLAC